jgi:hypothetical protein
MNKMARSLRHSALLAKLFDHIAVDHINTSTCTSPKAAQATTMV